MSDLAIELGYEGSPGLPHSKERTEGDEDVPPDTDCSEVEDGPESKKGWRGLFAKLRGRKKGRRKSE